MTLYILEKIKLIENKKIMKTTKIDSQKISKSFIGGQDCEKSRSFFINTKSASSNKLNPSFPKDIKRGVSFTKHGK